MPVDHMQRVDDVAEAHHFDLQRHGLASHHAHDGVAMLPKASCQMARHHATLLPARRANGTCDRSKHGLDGTGAVGSGGARAGAHRPLFARIRQSPARWR